MNFDLEDKEDQYLGAVFLLGLATVVYWCLGSYELISSHYHLLGLIGAMAFPSFGIAISALFWAAFQRTNTGGMPYYALAGILTGAALWGNALPSNGFGYALLSAGLLCGLRGLIVSLRIRGNEPLTQEEHVGFVLVAIWLFATLLSANALAAIRMATLLLVFWRLIPRLARTYARFAAFINNLLTPQVHEPEEDTSSGQLDEFGLSANDPYYNAKRIIAVFVQQNYKEWTEISFQPTEVSPSYITHVLTQPYTIKKDVFAKRDDDLNSALGLKNNSLLITLDGRRNAFLIQIALPREKVKPTYFETITEPLKPGASKEEIRIHGVIQRAWRKPYEFTVGLDPFNQPLFSNVEDKMFPHMLIAGGSGSGKSILLHTILVQLMLNNSPSTLRILFADAGLSTQGLYAKVPHLWRPVLRERGEMVEQLKDLVEEIRRRSQIWDTAGVPDRNSYLRHYPRDEMPLILLVVDEGAMFTSEKDLKDPYTLRVGEALKLGRKYGVHVIIGLQRPMADTLGQGFKDALSRRVILRLEAALHSANVLDGDERATKLRGQGDGLFKVGAELERFQSYYLPDSDDTGHKWVQDYVADIVERWGPSSLAPASAPVPTRHDLPSSAYSPASAQASSDAALAIEHQKTIDNTGWLVLRGLELAFDQVSSAYDNPPDFLLSNDTMMLFVKRATPEGYHSSTTVTPAFISETLSRISGRPAARGGRWPDFNRAIVSQKVAAYRQISEREWYILRGALVYLNNRERPDRLNLATIISAANAAGPSPLTPPLDPQETDAVLRRLAGHHWVENPNGEGEWGTALAVVKTLINGYGVVTSGPAVAAVSPRPRPTVDSIANRPPKDPF